MSCRFYIIVVMISLFVSASAEYRLETEYSLSTALGSGDFAPYYISSLRHGRITQSKEIQAEVSVVRKMDENKRFSYGFGATLIGGYASAVDYERFYYPTMSWYEHSERPSSFWIQQLYGEIRYRGIQLEIGAKEHNSALLTQSLTSGDLVFSGNTRPMPQLRVGFNDFQDIPLTDGWVQIDGELAYGKMLDDDWNRNHFNYYGWHITDNQWYNYKRCYFRTKPSKPFSVTVGLQAAAVFGGTTYYYYRGEEIESTKNANGLKTFAKMLLPYQDGGEGFYTGNHLGSWDLRARYRLRNGDEISAYFSWLWEDGSGIGKQNGWDGLWGIEYKASDKGLLNGMLVEYLDFTNQSGPIHYAPEDFPSPTITGHAAGADDYYNNATYNSYSYFGQSIGTPAMMAPIYNKDGYPAFIGNSLRGVHVGIEGSINRSIDYRIKGGYRKSTGTGKEMLPKPIRLTAIMLETQWRPEKVKGLSVNAQLECDRGSMPGNAFGVFIGVKYNGLLNL